MWSIKDIWVALRRGDEECLAALESRFEESPATLNFFDNENRTLLHWATSGHRVQVIEFLLKHNASVNARDFENRTPLHYACERGYIDVATTLLQGGADLTAKDSAGRTALYYAVHDSPVKNHWLVRALLEFGAGNYYRVCDAIIDNDVARLRELLENSSADDFSESAEECPLFLCVTTGNLEIVRAAIDNAEKIQPSLACIENALQIAIKNGFQEIVEFFFQQTQIQSLCKQKMIAEAVMAKQPSILDFLLKRIVLTNSAPLHVACTMASSECVRLLLLHGSQYVNEIDSKGNTALNIAAGIDKVEILNLLLQHGADPNIANSDGISPMHKVCRFFGHPEAIELLLNAGAHWDVRDKEGGTILHWAIKAQDGQSLKFLLEHETVDVNVNSRDVFGNSPLHGEPRISCDMLNSLLRNGGDMNLKNNLGHVPALPWECLRETRCSSLETLKKLKLLGYVVNRHEARIPLDKLEENCKIYADELNILQSIFLSWNPRISLRDIFFMSEKQLVAYTKNKILRELYENCGKNFESEYVHYGFLLNLRMKKALERRKLVDSGAEAFNEVTKSRLFEDSYEKIFSYFHKKDLENLIDCTKFCEEIENGGCT